MDRRQGGRTQEGVVSLRHRAYRQARPALDTIFETVECWTLLPVVINLGRFGWTQVGPSLVQVPKKDFRIHRQISNDRETIERFQRNRGLIQFPDVGHTRQPLRSVDKAGTGPAGRMVARVAVHERRVLVEANGLQTIQDRHLFRHGKGVRMKPGRIDDTGFVSFDAKLDILYGRHGVFPLERKPDFRSYNRNSDRM